jgi:hypothetical protein
VVGKVDNVKSEHGSLLEDHLQVHCIWWGRKLYIFFGGNELYIYCDSVTTVQDSKV